MNTKGLGATLLLTLVSNFCIADDFTIKVTTVASSPADNVALQSEDGMRRFDFSPKPDGRAFEGIVPKPDPANLAASNKLYTEYRLVANWPASNEQLYIRLHSLLPQELALGVYHNQDSFDVTALDQIDRLGSDLDSITEKYCRARAFHLRWRYDNSLPEHYLALRSARLWFDASVALALRRNSPFQLDKDIEKIMNDYEEQANTDRKFLTRYRRYAPAGYIRGMLDEVRGAEYAFVSFIPKLITEGRNEEAYKLNAKALNALTAETKVTKMIIEDRQGINLSILRGNSALLQTKLGL